MAVAPTTISLLPELPSSSAPANFASKGDAVIDALNNRISSLDSSNTNIYTNSLEVDTAKTLVENLEYYRANDFKAAPDAQYISSGNTVNFTKQGQLTGLISQNVTTDNTTKPRVLVTWEPLEETVSAVSFSGKVARTAGPSTTSGGLTFSSDGSKVYFCTGSGTLGAGIIVFQYTLMQPWDINTRRYNGQYFVAAEPGTFTSTPIRFSSDGTKFYISATAGSAGYSKIYQYNLGTPWEVKTAVFNNKISPYLTSSAGSAGFGGFFIGNNGSSLFVLFNNEELRQYVLSTPWDISTAVALNQTTLTGINTQGRGFVFDSTGTILMVVDASSGNEAIRRYNLSTAWNVTTVSSVAQSYTITATPYDVYFKSDGLTFYVIGNSSGLYVTVYTASSPWTISSGITSSVPVYYLEASVTPASLFFSSDGLKVFLDDSSGSSGIISYDLSTAWNLSTISNKKTLNTSYNTSKIALSSTGNYVFYTDASSLYRIPLSTAWDLNSANSQDQSRYSGTSTLTCLAFSQDGTKMYIGPYNGVIRQYTLSPAWSLSGSVYADKALDFRNELVTCDHIAFSPDGTSLLVSGYSINSSFSRTVVQYKLSTAWDLSTAVFLTYGARAKALVSSEGEFNYAADFAYSDTPGQLGSRLIVCGAGAIYNYYYLAGDENKIEKPYSLSTMTLNQDTSFTGIAFNNDGTKMYLAGDTNNRVFEYTLSQAYNPTSATVSYTNNSFLLPYNGPSAIRFSSDGTKLFVADGGTYAIYQYNLSTPWSIAAASSSPDATLDTAAAGSFLSGMCFSPDGTKLFISVSSSTRIRVYNLSTPWSLTGATLSIDFINTSTFMEDSYPSALDISADGRNIFVLRASGQRFVYRIELSTPYDLRTVTNVRDPLSGGYVKFFKSTEPGFTTGAPRAFDFKKSDGSSLYVTDGYWLQEYTLDNPYNLGKIYNTHFALGTYAQTTYPYNVSSTLLPVTIEYSTAGKSYVATSTSGQTFTITTLPPKAEDNPLTTFNITLVNRDSAPLSNSPGIVGQAYIDDYYFYLYTGLQSGWKRAPISLL